MKCAGKIRRGENKGKPCRKSAIAGRKHCAQHGGKTLIGPSHPNFKHGRRSRYLGISLELRAKYKEALADPELLALRSDVALLDARINELLEAGESQLLWSKAQDAFQQHKAAIRGKDAEVIKPSLGQLENLITRGHADSLRWNEIYRVIEHAGRAREREIKRLVITGKMIPVEEVYEQMNALVAILIDVAQQTITDRAILRNFANALAAVRVMGMTDDQVTLAPDQSCLPDISGRAALPPSLHVSDPAPDSTHPKRTTGLNGDKKAYLGEETAVTTQLQETDPLSEGSEARNKNQ
jgi:hypothetical protein